MELIKYILNTHCLVGVPCDPISQDYLNKCYAQDGGAIVHRRDGEAWLFVADTQDVHGILLEVKTSLALSQIAERIPGAVAHLYDEELLNDCVPYLETPDGFSSLEEVLNTVLREGDFIIANRRDHPAYDQGCLRAFINGFGWHISLEDQRLFFCNG